MKYKQKHQWNGLDQESHKTSLIVIYIDMLTIISIMILLGIAYNFGQEIWNKLLNSMIKGTGIKSRKLQKMLSSHPYCHVENIFYCVILGDHRFLPNPKTDGSNTSYSAFYLC